MSVNEKEVAAPDTDIMWSDLKDQVRVLVDKLEAEDASGVSTILEEINDTRDRNLYHEVGKLTRGLHEAIVNFDIDQPPAELNEGAESQMTNAQDRLDYVINLTQQSANKTMDMVEEGIPLANQIGEQSQSIRNDWQRLIEKDIDTADFPDLYKRVDDYLQLSGASSAALSDKLNTILLAQDFQDLTGQVIKKVIDMVQDVEVRLVELMRVAGQVEELTGIVRQEAEEKIEVTSAITEEVAAEGPQIKAKERDDVVSDQDDVDDLLSSLGF